MNIQDFCVQLNRSPLSENRSSSAKSSLKALRQLKEVDLQALLEQGLMAGYWDLWDPTEAPLTTATSRAV